MIFEFISDKSIDAFLVVDILRLAVERKLEIVGEAANRVSSDFKQMHREIPWKVIIGQRHIIVHDYCS